MKKVEIRYCLVWNYYARAVRLKEEIEEVFGDNVAVILTKSSGGRFDVFLNGEKVFSKTESFRFPEPSEIIQMIRQV